MRAYFENNNSVVTMTKKAFRLMFIIPRNNTVPDANTIRTWVNRLEGRGSTLKPEIIVNVDT